MNIAPSGSADRVVKVVLVGPPAAGKVAIVRAVAEEYSHSSVRAGELGEGKVYRTEFYWPELLPDGRRLRVRLFAVSGHPVYNAVTELALAGADGLVFVANLARERGEAARIAMKALVFNARQNGLDLSTLPAALLYQQPSVIPVPTPFFEPEQMDQWLGIPTGSVPRFVSEPGDQISMRAPVEWVIAQIARGSADRAEAPAPTREAMEAVAAAG